MTWLYTGIAQAAEARSRVLVRHLARRLDRPEAEIVLARDSFGKPMLADPDSGYWFNCASCDGLLLIAGSRQGPVGADVETLERCIPVWEDASQGFAPAERALLAALPAARRPLAFARLWTAKEAVLKARGTGIVDGLAEPDLSFLRDLADSPPWISTKVNVGGDRFAVSWYTLPMDEALAIAARAEAAPNLEMT
ncbi:4'-phosphopantetheinyl transferase family protein [Paramagnetospirillum magneticum]|nr:4'-phosphopantetheinyl transferase superfamily protein [Paramagnetospirillum magneticum]